jgi:hypothetical protein
MGVEAPGHPTAAVEVDDSRQQVTASLPEPGTEPAVDPDTDIGGPGRPRDNPAGDMDIGADRHHGTSGAPQLRAHEDRVVSAGSFGGAIGFASETIRQLDQGLRAPVQHPPVPLHRSPLPKQREHQIGMAKEPGQAPRY